MFDSEKLAYLRLVRSKNIGFATISRLIDAYGSALKALSYLNDFPQKNIIIASLAEIEKEILAVEKFGAKFLFFNDENYPRILKEIPNPALVLTLKGDLELFQKDIIAIVGARNASLNGLNFAKKISADLAQNSIVTISGLARGIDAAAHEASYKSGTIAVIAGSIDNIYPKENKLLYEKIFENGLVLTEMPFGAPPRPENFVQRNRLISGLSLGVVIVEAGLKSGSLTTAKFALEQGREVFAVPGFPFDPRCQGSNHLIKQGAKLTENIDDILEEFLNLKRKYIESESPSIKEEKPIIIDNEIKQISAEILQKLSFTPVTIEELIAELQISSKLINIALVQLELTDKIEINFGKINLKNHAKI